MNLYKYNDIHKVPELPGIYAWFLNLNNAGLVNPFHNVFKTKSFKATLEGNFKENYAGELFSSSIDFLPSAFDMQLLSRAIVEFNVPLYIGISKNLQVRLSQHQKLINKSVLDKVSYNYIDSNEVFSDTDVESEYFGRRMADIIKNHFSLNNIYIKTIELDTSTNREKLVLVENYLNRTFLPVLGRN